MNTVKNEKYKTKSKGGLSWKEKYILKIRWLYEGNKNGYLKK